MPVKFAVKPSKSFFRMTLITPDTASEPYIADAPPVIISTRSIRAAGIVDKSTVASPGVPATWRLPLIKTNVLDEPKRRKSAELVPAASLLLLLPIKVS